MTVNSNRLNSGWTYTDQIDRTAEGIRVLDFYVHRYTHSTSAEWERRIADGQVRLNGHRTDPAETLRRGQALSYHRPPWVEPTVPLAYGVLCADDHILVVDKPSGLPVLPGGHHLQHTLLYQVRDRFGGNPSPIHRLGRGTSGIVLFARCRESARRLSLDLRDGRMAKIYRALVEGIVDPDAFGINCPIDRIPHPKLGYIYGASGDGRTARSECRVLFRSDEKGRSLLRVRILTGRPHQIRIHLAAVGHPLVGDPLYRPGGLPISLPVGGRYPLPGDCGYHLHAHRLSFRHPASGSWCSFTSPPPASLRPPNEPGP